MRKLSCFILIFVIIGSILCLPACSGNKDNEITVAPGSQSDAITTNPVTIAPGSHPVVKVTMKGGDSFNITLYPEYAPGTVQNFVNLVDSGYYDGVTFHRIVEGFMAQGGDSNGDGMTDAGAPTIYGEFKNNGYNENKLSHTRGVISMARTSMDMNSAYSQFFICYTDCSSSLDGDYAAFGKVDEEGMKVVDSFLKVERVMGARW